MALRLFQLSLNIEFTKAGASYGNLRDGKNIASFYVMLPAVCLTDSQNGFEYFIFFMVPYKVWIHLVFFLIYGLALEFGREWATTLGRWSSIFNIAINSSMTIEQAFFLRVMQSICSIWNWNSSICWYPYSNGNNKLYRNKYKYNKG